MSYNLAVIGGGPAGYVAAERAGAAGMSVILFEDKELGGTCLNEGCIPTKTLLCSAKLYDHASHSEKYGVSVTEAVFDYGKMMDRKNKVVKKLVGGVRVAMRNHNVNVVRAHATIEGKTEGGFSLLAGEDSFIAEKILICTGSESVIPPIPGLAEAGDRVVTSRELLSLRELPSSIVIIGGGVIGMEFASLYNSLGVQVTVIEMLPEILGSGLDAEIAAMLRAVYTKKGIKFHLGCKVVGVNDSKVKYLDEQGVEAEIEADRILLSVGRKANVKGIGLENIGLEAVRGIKVDEHMRTEVPGVYAAGDVTGFSLLAHTASREGEVAVNDMLGIEDKMSYDAIPGVVYTNPEVAGVGITEAGAAQKAIKYEVRKLPMAYSGRFVAENEGGSGICKMISDETGRVLGVHMIGNPCSEIISACCVAIEQKMTVEDLKKVVFPHPTVAEILKETAFSPSQE